METEVAGWTADEQLIAKSVFDNAQSRDMDSLIGDLRSRADKLQSQQDIWQLHDYLSIRRHEIEGRFDFRLPGLLFVFASLVKDGLVRIEELDGLSDEKLAKITAMSRM